MSKHQDPCEFRCPHCGRRVLNAVERPADPTDKRFHAERDRLYVLYEPVSEGLGECRQHGLLRLRRLRRVGPPARPGPDGRRV